MKSLMNKLYLNNLLYTFRIKRGTSIYDRLDEFYTILIDLENLDVQEEDEDIVMFLVISLSSINKGETYYMETVKHHLFQDVKILGCNLSKSMMMKWNAKLL